MIFIGMVMGKHWENSDRHNLTIVKDKPSKVMKFYVPIILSTTNII